MPIEHYIIWAMGAFISLQCLVNVISVVVVIKLEHSQKKEREGRHALLADIENSLLRIRYLSEDHGTMYNYLTVNGHVVKTEVTDKGFSYIKSIRKIHG